MRPTMEHAEHRPEVLAPAGCLQRLKTAVSFGADAVYVGGTKFGLRKNADNLNEHELASGIAFAHEHGSKVYVTCNVYPLERDWPTFAPYIEQLNRLKPDALIIADPGVARFVRDNSDLRIHVSTQASVLNTAAAQVWKERGASRIVVGRELSIEEAATIRREAGIEIETFAHGAMCTSHSGKCVISNYTAGRDANRGGCVQTCRHDFHVHPGREAGEQADYNAPIMNARDLMAIDLVPQLTTAHIDALKIEGRMKSEMYVASTVAAYRCAVDGRDNPARDLIRHLSNRDFTTGGLEKRPYKDALNFAFTGYNGDLMNIGQVLEFSETHGAFVYLKAPLTIGETINWLHTDGTTSSQKITHLTDAAGRSVERMVTSRGVWIGCEKPIAPYSIAYVFRDGHHVNPKAKQVKAASA